MKNSQSLLLTQSMGDQTVTVAQGQTPVIRVLDTMLASEVTLAVNCLRSGAPSAQLLFIRGSTASEDMGEKVEKLLGKLALPGEKFECSGETTSNVNFVLLLTRKIS